MKITKEGNILLIEYMMPYTMGLEKHAENLQTGRSVSLLPNNGGVKTEILCNSLMTYQHTDVNTINGVPITNNAMFYDELIKML